MYIKRKIYKKLAENLKNNKIIILTGARQVGKTTLMKMLLEEINDKNNTAFIDMDVASNREYAESLESFLDFLILNGYKENRKKFYIFVDEFQKAPELGVIFKNIYDHHPNIKVIASGSSSLAIKSKIKESLAGRKFIFDIYPLDFEEFLMFKKDNQILGYYNNISSLKSEDINMPAKFNKYLDEFLMFGGYPEIALSVDVENKKNILKSIFDLYVEKDILTFSGIENIAAFKKLIELLALRNGQMINFDQLAKESSIHNKTVRSYISLLEDTYLIEIVRPFHSNKKKEIIKTPKVYFLDSGVRNYFLNNYNEIAKRVDSGQIWESYILEELLKNGYSKLKFWRTKQGQEVDFIIEDNGVIPLEVKYKSEGKVDDYNNLLYFLKEQNLNKGYVLSRNYNKILKKEKKEVKFLPAINFVKKV